MMESRAARRARLASAALQGILAGMMAEQSGVGWWPDVRQVADKALEYGDTLFYALENSPIPGDDE